MNVYTKILSSVALFSVMAVAQANPPQIPHPIDDYKITEGNKPLSDVPSVSHHDPGPEDADPAVPSERWSARW